jgi:lysozyme family protein
LFCWSCGRSTGANREPARLVERPQGSDRREAKTRQTSVAAAAFLACRQAVTAATGEKEMSFFAAAFAIIVGAEGGYTNNPADPGGETKYGISKRAYPDEDIVNLTLERAQELYKRDYWDKLNCDGMPWELALINFDCAVNQGIGIARAIQRLAKDASEFQAERGMRYAALPTFETFGRGWMRRLFHIFKAAQVTPP